MTLEPGDLLDRPAAALDADELAVLLAAAFEAEGRAHRFLLRGDGETWVSVECVPREDRP